MHNFVYSFCSESTFKRKLIKFNFICCNQIICIECPTAMVWSGCGSHLQGSPLDLLPLPPSALPMPHMDSSLTEEHRRMVSTDTLTLLLVIAYKHTNVGSRLLRFFWVFRMPWYLLYLEVDYFYSIHSIISKLRYIYTYAIRKTFNMKVTGQHCHFKIKSITNDIHM